MEAISLSSCLDQYSLIRLIILASSAKFLWAFGVETTARCVPHPLRLLRTWQRQARWSQAHDNHQSSIWNLGHHVVSCMRVLPAIGAVSIEYVGVWGKAFCLGPTGLARAEFIELTMPSNNNVAALGFAGINASIG